jgi:hypothetical protein
MKTILKNILFISLPTLLFLLVPLELFFRLVIPAAEKPIAYFDEKNKMLRSSEKRRTEGLYTIGKYAQIRGHWRINNFGWNSVIDYEPAIGSRKRLIGIIGDSYVRSLQVDVDKSFIHLLRNKLHSEYEVYSFGHDGAPFSQYLHMSRYANNHFDPETLVFLIIHNDFDESVSQMVSKPYFLQLSLEENRITETIPRKQKLFQFLTYSAIFRYLYSNIHLSSIYFNLTQKTKKYNANIITDSLLKKKEIFLKTTNYLVKKIKDENPDKRIIFLMDAPRNDIYENRLETSNLLWLHEIVFNVCAKNELELIDLTNPFHIDYLKHHKRFNSEIDGHWNEYGHEKVAEILYHYLMKDRNKKETGDTHKILK